MRKTRNGLTLIEVIVSIFLFAIGALGLAASSAAITLQMRLNVMRSRSAHIARNRAEIAQAGTCSAITSGSETAGGISSTWTKVEGRPLLIDQNLERPAATGSRSDQFHSAVPCD